MLPRVRVNNIVVVVESSRAHAPNRETEKRQKKKTSSFQRSTELKYRLLSAPCRKTHNADIHPHKQKERKLINK